MRFIRFIADNARGMLLIFLAVAGITVLAVANRTEDVDARWCVDRGGEVVVDEFPRQPDIRRCVVDGKTVRTWKRENGRNVLIIDWKSTPTP
jgi:hypothetical protein